MPLYMQTISKSEKSVLYRKFPCIFMIENSRKQKSFWLIMLALLLFISSLSDAFIRPPKTGLMKLCPPGGESFAAAWEITCGMRRKKKSSPVEESVEKMEFTSKYDNTISNDLGKFPKRRDDLATNRSKMHTYGKLKDSNEYRAPSMTEMMLFCCRFGCSLRELMPYCDPFGQWDS